jgi:hypothetical protein
MFGDSTVAYILLPYSNSMQHQNPLSINYFYFNNPQLSIVNMGIENNSLLWLRFNQPLMPEDSIGYNGFSGTYPLTYISGLKVEDFNLAPVHVNGVTKKLAQPGMIRFNTDTGKFEYYNGINWINMN